MRKIRTLAAFAGVLRTLGNPVFLIRGVAPWLVLSVAVHAVRLVYDDPLLGVSIVRFLDNGVFVLAVAAVALNTHRFILRRQYPGLPSVSGLHWDYFWRAFRCQLPALIAFAISAVFILVAFSANVHNLNNGDWTAFGYIAALYVALASGVLIAPRALSLPALATDRAEFSVFDGVKAAAASQWQLMLLSIVVFLVGWGAMIGIESLLSLLPEEASNSALIADAVFLPATVMVATLLWSAMLSFAYAGLALGDTRYGVELPATETADAAPQTP